VERPTGPTLAETVAVINADVFDEISVDIVDVNELAQ
jgi:hypothetical protein